MGPAIEALGEEIDRDLLKSLNAKMDEFLKNKTQ